jgi:hypothetical protein
LCHSVLVFYLFPRSHTLYRYNPLAIFDRSFFQTITLCRAMRLIHMFAFRTPQKPEIALRTHLYSPFVSLGLNLLPENCSSLS